MRTEAFAVDSPDALQQISAASTNGAKEQATNWLESFVATGVASDSGSRRVWLSAALTWLALSLVFSLVIFGPRSYQNNRSSRRQSVLAITDVMRASTWRQFKNVVTTYFTNAGFKISQISGAEDLLLERDGKTYLGQCNYWQYKSVDVPVVRESLNMMVGSKVDGVAIVCTGGFTPEARRYAQDKPVDLIGAMQLEKSFQALKEYRALKARNTRVSFLIISAQYLDVEQNTVYKILE